LKEVFTRRKIGFQIHPVVQSEKIL
jgi:hypothetical protein